MQPLDILKTPRSAQERIGKIRVHPSGLYVNPLALRAEDIRIEDIAHHLSNICRYTGACPTFYSVAQHSVHVAYHLRSIGAPWDLVLAGLLHDAGEYVFNDIASPVKHDPRMAWYSEMEHQATELIYSVFELSTHLLPMTKSADDEIFRQEVETWWGGKSLIHPWSAPKAESDFLQSFRNIQYARGLGL